MIGQLVFIDESGDAGFKTNKGSSVVLAVAAVIFECADHAEHTASVIKDLRRQLGKSERFQFHFSHMSRDERERFFAATRNCPFRVRAVVMAKDKIYHDSELYRRGDRFYNYAMKCLLKYSFGKIENAKLFVDGEAGRESLGAMVAYLRHQCNTQERCVFAKIRFVSKRENNVLVQLADMAVGAIARSYRVDKGDAHTYRDLMQSRIDNVWNFGKGR